jgi:hypothetical protein
MTGGKRNEVRELEGKKIKMSKWRKTNEIFGKSRKSWCFSKTDGNDDDASCAAMTRHSSNLVKFTKQKFHPSITTTEKALTGWKQIDVCSTSGAKVTTLGCNQRDVRLCCFEGKRGAVIFRQNRLCLIKHVPRQILLIVFADVFFYQDNQNVYCIFAFTRASPARMREGTLSK